MAQKKAGGALAILVLAVLAVGAGPAAFAFWGSGAALPVFKIAIKGRSFVPTVLAIPSDQKIKILVSNENKEPSEFESFSLHREQVVVGGAQIAVFVGPLKAGAYDFFDDFQSGVKGLIQAGPR